MARLRRSEQRFEEAKRRELSPELKVDTASAVKIVQVYKKKAVSRLKTFYAESQKMDKKLPELIEKVESIGFHIDELTLNEYDKMCLTNYRKKTKSVTFNVVGHRDEYKLTGTLSITPASMQLILNSSQLKQVTTKNGFGLPLLKVTYYRTLNVRDNYLASLLAGKVPTWSKYEQELGPVPF